MCILNVDIAICTETWLTSDAPNEAFNAHGFDCFRTDRNDDSGYGGVGLWTKKNLKARKLIFPAYNRIEVCAIQIPSRNLLVIAIYLPPGILEKPFADFCESFVSVTDDILNQFPCHRLIVAGDFNRYSCTFLSSIFSLRNIVTGATRLNANLDLIFVDDRLATSYAPDDVVIGPPNWEF